MVRSAKYSNTVFRPPVDDCGIFFTVSFQMFAQMFLGSEDDCGIFSTVSFQMFLGSEDNCGRVGKNLKSVGEPGCSGLDQLQSHVGVDLVALVHL